MHKDAFKCESTTRGQVSCMQAPTSNHAHALATLSNHAHVRCNLSASNHAHMRWHRSAGNHAHAFQRYNTGATKPGTLYSGLQLESHRKPKNLLKNKHRCSAIWPDPHHHHQQQATSMSANPQPCTQHTHARVQNRQAASHRHLQPAESPHTIRSHCLPPC